MVFFNIYIVFFYIPYHFSLYIFLKRGVFVFGEWESFIYFKVLLLLIRFCIFSFRLLLKITFIFHKF